MWERMWRTSALERERTKERRERERRRRKREKERECFLFFIRISFFSVQSTLHFRSVFGCTVMTWKHSSLPLLPLTVFLILSLFLQLTQYHTDSFLLSLSLPPPSLSPSLSLPLSCYLSIKQTHICTPHTFSFSLSFTLSPSLPSISVFIIFCVSHHEYM